MGGVRRHDLVSPRTPGSRAQGAGQSRLEQEGRNIMLSLRREGKLPCSSYFSPGALVRLCGYLEGAPFFFCLFPGFGEYFEPMLWAGAVLGRMSSGLHIVSAP